MDASPATVKTHRALVRVTGVSGWSVEPTKTRNERTLELAPAWLAMLTAMRARQTEAARVLGREYREENFLFASTFGEPLHIHAILQRLLPGIVGRAACRLLGIYVPALGAPNNSKAYRAARAAHDALLTDATERADLSFVTLYTFRRTLASLMYELGKPNADIQKVLGHSRASTADTYIVNMAKQPAQGSTAVATLLAQHPAPVVEAPRTPLQLVKTA